MQQYVITPDGRTIYEDSIVILRRFPETKWILHHGFYSFEGSKHNGWYFVSVPGEITMPMYQPDLVGIRVVEGGGGPCPPGPCPPGPCPPGPCPPPYPPTPPGPYPPGPPMSYPFTKYDRDTVFRAAITVDNLKQLHALEVRDIQDGKVARVNDFEGRVEYFEWSAENQTWELLSLGDRYPDSEEIASKYATIESVEELNAQVSELEHTFEVMDWEDIDALVEDLENG